MLEAFGAERSLSHRLWGHGQDNGIHAVRFYDYKPQIIHRKESNTPSFTRERAQNPLVERL